MTRHSRLLVGNGEPLKVILFLCFVCFNKVAGNMVTFRRITQAAGVENGLESGGRETH